MRYTEHYKLKMPEGKDIVDIEDINSNMNVIDGQFKIATDKFEKLDNLKLDIGDKNQLSTVNKTDLVGAIKEVHTNLRNELNNKIDKVGKIGLTTPNNITPDQLNILLYKFSDSNFSGIGVNSGGCPVISVGIGNPHVSNFEFRYDNLYVLGNDVWHKGNLNPPKTGKLTAVQLNDTKLASGMYTNSGDGLLDHSGNIYLYGWYHVFVSHHYDENGCGGQIALCFSNSDVNLIGKVYSRIANGTTWTQWKEIGGSSSSSGTTIDNLVWNNIL